MKLLKYVVSWAMPSHALQENIHHERSRTWIGLCSFYLSLERKMCLMENKMQENAILSFSQMLLQFNSCFVGVNLLELCFRKVSEIFCPK